MCKNLRRENSRAQLVIRPYSGHGLYNVRLMKDVTLVDYTYSAVTRRSVIAFGHFYMKFVILVTVENRPNKSAVTSGCREDKDKI